MSSEHLSTIQIERFCAKALADDEISAVANHITECDACEHRFVQELRRQNPLPSRYTEDDLAFCVRNCHLEFESLMSLAEGALDSGTQWLFGLHLKTCERCAEDLKACKRCLEEDPRDEDWSN